MNNFKQSLFIGTYLWAQSFDDVTFKRKLDDLRIYNLGLSKEEIISIMEE